MEDTDFMLSGTIKNAELTEGRGNDTTIHIGIEYDSWGYQAFTGFYFGEGEKNARKAAKFLDDAAALFGCSEPAKLIGKKVFALRNERHGVIVGLMNPETKAKFIAAEWFQENYGIPLVDEKSRKKELLLLEEKNLLQKLHEVRYNLNNLDKVVQGWKS